MNSEIEDNDRSLTEITIDPYIEKFYQIDNNLVSPSLKETIILHENVDNDYFFEVLSNNNSIIEGNDNESIPEENDEEVSNGMHKYLYKTSTPLDRYKYTNYIEASSNKFKNKLNDKFASHSNLSKNTLPNKTSQNFDFIFQKNEEENKTVKTNLNDLKSALPRQHKPRKVLNQIGSSKSLGELNYIEKEKSNLSYRENTQSVENLIFKENNFSSLETPTFHNHYDAPKRKFFDKRRYHSTFDLIKEEQIPKQDFEPLNRSKSYSLTNLASSQRRPNYSHVQSKVKQYIQERKRQESKERENNIAKLQSKSLPATPMKQKYRTTTSLEEVLLLDEKTLASLSSATIDHKESLPIEVRKIENEMHDENARIKILTSLLSQLQEERQSRVNLGSTLNALQLDYNNLLAQFAQAKNTIDDLRLYKNISEKNSDIQQESKPNQRHIFQKALSTPNIFSEWCSLGVSKNHSESTKSTVNLVKATSSPLVDPDVSLTIKLVKDKCDNEQTLKRIETNPHIEEKLNDKKYFGENSSYNAWIEDYQYVYQKVSSSIIRMLYLLNI